MDQKQEHWVIHVGGGYGSFLFGGTEDEAEVMRVHKSNWEMAVAWKRRANAAEIKTGTPSRCFTNHDGFMALAPA